MRKTIRIAALVLALVMVFAACGRNDEEDIRAVVETFFEKSLSMDLSGALACIDENSDYYTECSENGPLGLSADNFSTEKLLGSGAEAMLGDKSEDFIDGIIDMTRRHSGYTVDTIDLESKDKAVATVTLSLPDYDNIDTNSMAESISEISSIEIDALDFQNYVIEQSVDLETVSDSELESLIYRYLQEKGFLDTIIEAILSSMDENVSSESVEAVFTLERIKGRWLITGEN